MTKEEYIKFIEDCKELLNDKTASSKKWPNDRFPLLIDDQAFYVFNWKKGELVFATGFEQLLGRDSKNILITDLTHDLVHPDDRSKVKIITREVSQFGLKNKIPSGSIFKVSYRLKHKEGHHIKVLRMSGLFESDQNGHMYSNYSLITNLDSFDKTNKVNWSIWVKDINTDDLERKIKNAIKTKLTLREIEVLEYICLGLRGKEIAEKLYISIETVKTHRKNLLSKLHASNVIELLIKAREAGLVD